MDLSLLVPIIIVAALVIFVAFSAVRVVPQARRYNVERFGRYRTTLQPGLNFIIPLADRINTKLDVREQVYSSQPKPVITEDNLVVNIDTVLYYQITDPRAAAYEVANYLQAPGVDPEIRVTGGGWCGRARNRRRASGSCNFRSGA
jgi:regulator of protease activity HflC (stomatin/prohibitin superfamily)